MQGVWGENLDTRWEFILSNSLPEEAYVSAVMAIPFWNGKFALVHTKRGWGIPGGHREKEENVSECLERELEEEIGAHKIGSRKLFGYRKIMNPERKIGEKTERKYPKDTIVPYYLVELEELPTGAHAEDCFTSDLFNITDSVVLNSHDHKIILIGYSLYQHAL